MIRSSTHVEAVEIAAQPPRLDPHDRVDLGVERLVPTEDVHRDRGALQALAPPGKRLFDEVTQEPLPPVTRLERKVGENAVKLGPDLIHIGRGGLITVGSRGVHALALSFRDETYHGPTPTP